MGSSVDAHCRLSCAGPGFRCRSGRIVEFAEKPKGEALKKMQVDTTILGLDKEA